MNFGTPGEIRAAINHAVSLRFGYVGLKGADAAPAVLIVHFGVLGALVAATTAHMVASD